MAPKTVQNQANMSTSKTQDLGPGSSSSWAWYKMYFSADVLLKLKNFLSAAQFFPRETDFSQSLIKPSLLAPTSYLPPARSWCSLPVFYSSETQSLLNPAPEAGIKWLKRSSTEIRTNFSAGFRANRRAILFCKNCTERIGMALFDFKGKRCCQKLNFGN